MTNRSWVGVLPALLVVGACTSFDPSDVAEPSKVTVDEAMATVGKGFVRLRQELEASDVKRIGVIACKIIVNFNVSAAAGEENKLVLDLKFQPAPNPVATAQAGANAEFAATASAARGNTIAIEMYNPACLPKDTFAYQNPDKVGGLYDGVKRETPEFAPPQ